MTATGGRPRVVLLHGWSIDSRIWGELRERLSDRYEVLTPDLPGHGGVPVDLGDRPAEAFHGLAVDFYGSWCRQHGVEGCPMVAWAWGTQVLVDAVATGAVRPPSVALVSFAAPFQSPRTYQAVLADWPRLAAKLVARMGSEPLPPDLARRLQALMTSSSLVAVAAVQSAPWQPPGPQFRLPPGSLAITGAADQLTPASAGRPLLDLWGGRQVLLDGAGHLPFLEAQAAFDAVLLRWLGQATAPR